MGIAPVRPACAVHADRGTWPVSWASLLPVSPRLRLLKLAPEVLKAIAALGDPLPSPIVTERRLQPIVNLPAKEESRRVEPILRERTAFDA